MSGNMHYYYNVEYFQDALLKEAPKDESECYDQHNKDIYHFTFHDGSYLEEIIKEEQFKEKLQSFSLRTVYPGLLIGIGYSHAGKVPREEKNEKKNKVGNVIIGGFFFDYVTGIPILPGSTIKGMLRSCFREGERWEVINELAKGLGVDLSETDIIKLKKNLFEERDVFLGGFPVIGANGKVLLDSEYITPHKKPFKDPIPISLLKVRPGIEFQFVFLLFDYVSENGKIILNAEQKVKLYKELLLLGGIGAKTNVGFGQFVE